MGICKWDSGSMYSMWQWTLILRNDELLAAKKKADFFKGLLDAQSKETLLDQYKAINSVPTLVGSNGDNTRQRNRTKAIHLKKIAKCEQEIRQELFQSSEDDGSKTKKLHSGKNFDDIVKYHKLLQENVTNEMIELTRNLKHNITASNEIVKKDTEVWENFTVAYQSSANPKSVIVFIAFGKDKQYRRYAILETAAEYK